MEAFTSYERLHLDSFEEIRRSQHFEVYSVGLDEQLRPAIGDDLAEYLPEWENVSMAGGLVSHQLRFSEFFIAWKTTGPLPLVHGEIDVFPLLDVVEQGEGPPIRYPTTEFQRRFLSQLRCIAGSRGSGNGHLTHLRVQPDASPVEIWFDDEHADTELYPSHPYPCTHVKLDLTYGEYVDALLATKGTRGWEFLFTDIELGKPYFHDIVTNLRNMLEVFPRLFPACDYTPFRERLAARL
ncbi:hypothetical protein AB0B45_04850 [Nonomuraea sp. NPDC049152]|uniref:hypothetical protein n=1 Tax=Nonomuraea sp. NPDC049152 TaxID=3154350 RepID=UPI0033FCDA8D